MDVGPLSLCFEILSVISIHVVVSANGGTPTWTVYSYNPLVNLCHSDFGKKYPAFATHSRWNHKSASQWRQWQGIGSDISFFIQLNVTQYLSGIIPQIEALRSPGLLVGGVATFQVISSFCVGFIHIRSWLTPNCLFWYTRVDPSLGGFYTPWLSDQIPLRTNYPQYFACSTHI